MFRSKRRQKKLEEKRRKWAERVRERKKQERDGSITIIGYVTIGGLERER